MAQSYKSPVFLFSDRELLLRSLVSALKQDRLSYIKKKSPQRDCPHVNAHNKPSDVNFKIGCNTDP